MPHTALALPGALCLVAALTIGAAAQSTAPRNARASSPEFTRIHSAVPLDGSLVIVLDARERNASVVDLASGAVRPFARRGAGPQELGLPWRLIALGGDSAAVIDAQHARALIVRPNGEPGAFVRVPGGPSPFSLAQHAATARLARGYIVSERRSGASVTLWRTTAEGQPRQIATLAPPQNAGRPQSVRIGNHEVVRQADPSGGTMEPFPYPHEIWELADDGWTVVVSRSPYRVRWVSPAGAVHEGPTITVEAARITDATRDSVATEHVRELPALVAPRPGRYRWPAALPAFAVGRTPTLFIDPRGRAWVRRLHLGEEPALYDVFDRNGERVRQVRLQPNERLVGFTQSHLLVATRNADELEALTAVRIDP